MAEIVRPELAEADGAEVTHRLRQLGIANAAISTWLEDDGLHIVAVGVAADLIASKLEGWAPTAERGKWEPPLDGELALHVQHLRDYVAAVEDPLLPDPTGPQTQHIVVDIIRALRFLEKRLE